MSYLGLSDAKTLLGLAANDTADDAFVGALLLAAQAAIDQYCLRSLEATVATRRYGPAAATGARLWLDGDLVAVTTLTNGDGSVLPPAAYRLGPRNTLPAQWIDLLGGAAWQWAVDGEVVVTGMWGYSLVPSADVVQAARELVAQLYRSYDRQAMPGVQQALLGTTAATATTVLGALPPATLALLAPYRRYH